MKTSFALLASAIVLVACSDPVRPPSLTRATATAASTVDPGSGTWARRANMPAFRRSAGGAAVGGKLYVMGGLDENGNAARTEVFAFNQGTNSWTTKAPLPIALYEPGVVAYNGKLYLFGGSGYPSGYNQITYIYDPTLNSWSPAASIGAWVHAPSVVACNGRIYVMGGSPTNGFNKGWVYNPAQNKFNPMPDLPRVRQTAAAVCINNNIYITGGNQGTHEQQQTLDIYSTVTKTWSTGATSPLPGVQRAAVVNGIMYMFQVYPTDAPLAYDPVNDAWTALKPAPVGAYVYDAVVGAINGKVISAATNESTTPGYTSHKTWAFTPAALVP